MRGPVTSGCLSCLMVPPPPTFSFVGVTQDVFLSLGMLVGRGCRCLHYGGWFLFWRFMGGNVRGVLCLICQWKHCSGLWWSRSPQVGGTKYIGPSFFHQRSCIHLVDYGLYHLLDIMVLNNLSYFSLLAMFGLRKRVLAIWYGAGSWYYIQFLWWGIFEIHGRFLMLFYL